VGICLGAVVVGLFVLVTAVPTARASTGTGSGWTIITSPNTGPSQSNLLMGSTCTSAWNCWAVGGVFSSSQEANPQPNAILDQWNGTAWSPGPDVDPPGTQASLLWSVSCVTASDCWAVGAQEPDGQQAPDTLAEHWNGSAWSVVATPAGTGYLFSVTCTSASDCWAVGNNLDSQKNPLNGIIDHWNGSQWSPVARASSGQTYDQFDSVTCASSSDCWAVGYAGPNQIQYGFIPGVIPSVAGSTALVEHWNGTDWTLDPMPASSGGGGQYLSSVTCTGDSDCWAVGGTMDSTGEPSATLIENWNGSAWTTATGPEPPMPADLLTTVTCTDASDCWATGGGNASGGQNNQSVSPFIESWNGSDWSVDPTPNTMAFGYLSGLSCVRGSGCFATGLAGTQVNNNLTTQTLIEQLRLPAFGNQGVWISGADGGVFALGTAGFYGSTGSAPMNAPVVGMAATPDGGGYWLVGADGGVFAFGDAGFFGSAGGLHLNKPIVGMAATPDGGGYWLVASDGGVFAYGDAGFHGSAGSLSLDKPIVGMASTPDGGGYWLVASDGGVFAFGDAGFHGSVPGQGIASAVPMEGMVATTDGGGYWIVGQNGALYAFGDAGFLGSLAGVGLSAPITGAAQSS
jgi:hypothetical protein